jgi:hypothetical protein
MSARRSTLALAAIAALAVSTLMPVDASAAGHANRAAAAPAKVVSSHPAHSLGWGYGRGRGYGRGWCYWHPYACQYRAY